MNLIYILKEIVSAHANKIISDDFNFFLNLME